MSKRVIVYGDIHGCFSEFMQLREKIKPNKKDIEIVVGDAINKGPFSKETIKFIRKNHILMVLGNNEDKFLRCLENKDKCSERFWSYVKRLKKKDILFLKSLPYYIKIKNLTVVHGGIPLGIKLDDNLTKEQKRELTLLRYYDKNLKSLSWTQRDKRYKYWAELYDGKDGFVIYGHNPFKKAKLDKYAVGVDTGCVYGGSLTAAVFRKKKEQYDTKEFEIISVKARKKYFK